MIECPARVKDALRDGSYNKNFRFDVYGEEGKLFTIDNQNLVSESVSFDEKMCSGSELKFGLCEGTNLEFQYFNFPNITNKYIWAYIDCDYIDEDGNDNTFTIPMGRFDVKECSRQASTGIIKVSAYNKLLSDYLDEKANEQIATITSDGIDQNTITAYAITSSLLRGYNVDTSDLIEYAVPVEVDVPAPTPHFTGPYALDAPICEFNDGSQYFSLGFWQGSSGVKNIDIDIETGTFTGYKRVIIDYPKEYIDYINDFYDEMCAYIRANFKNPETAIKNIMASSYAEYFGIRVLFSDGDTSSVERNGRYYTEYLIDKVTYIRSSTKVKQTFESVATLLNVRSIVPSFPLALFNGSGADGTNNYFFVYSGRTREELLDIANKIKISVKDVNEYDKLTLNKNDLPDVTLRELQSAQYEMECQFGRLSRTTDLFGGTRLNGTRLLPSDTLYPSDALYPLDNAERTNPSIYSKLWADEGNIRNFRYLIVTYKGLDAEGKETEKTLQRTVNTNGTDDYNMSSNWIFKNLVWNDADVGKYADAMVELMRNISWFPFEMWAVGLPYLETGDEVEIASGDATYTSYILQRQLKGIQNLQDTYINGTLNIF